MHFMRFFYDDSTHTHLVSIHCISLQLKFVFATWKKSLPKNMWKCKSIEAFYWIPLYGTYIHSHTDAVNIYGLLRDWFLELYVTKSLFHYTKFVRAVDGVCFLSFFLSTSRQIPILTLSHCSIILWN